MIELDSLDFKPELLKRGFGILKLVPASHTLSIPLLPFEGKEHSETRQGTDWVSLLSLKQLALEKLPKASDLRALILSEPDSMPREVAIAKAEVFSRLLYKEFSKP